MHDKIKAASTSSLVLVYLNATMCLEKQISIKPAYHFFKLGV